MFIIEIILIFVCVLSYFIGRKHKEQEQKDKEDTAILTGFIILNGSVYEIKNIECNRYYFNRKSDT